MLSPTRHRYTRARIRDQLIREIKKQYGLDRINTGMLGSEYLAILSTVTRKLRLKLDSFGHLGPNSTPDEAVEILWRG